VTRPKIAVAIGRPMATTVPNVTSRTRIATPMPTTSLTWVSGLETLLPR
jgi:hypothetical protein